MKHLLLLGALGLLFLFIFSCQRNSKANKGLSRPHQVVCFDTTSLKITYEKISIGNVYAFSIFDKGVLNFKDKDGKSIQIDLSKNACRIY